jgi:hypothetical protein
VHDYDWTASYHDVPIPTLIAAMHAIYFALAPVLALVVVSFDVVATISLIRTDQLTRFQKIAQTVIVWSVPFIGAWLVLHLIAQSDRTIIPRWVPNESINEYVFQALGIESKVSLSAAENQVEHAFVDLITGHSSHSDGGDTRAAARDFTERPVLHQ